MPVPRMKVRRTGARDLFLRCSSLHVPAQNGRAWMFLDSGSTRVGARCVGAQCAQANVFVPACADPGARYGFLDVAICAVPAQGRPGPGQAQNQCHNQPTQRQPAHTAHTTSPHNQPTQPAHTTSPHHQPTPPAHTTSPGLSFANVSGLQLPVEHNLVLW